MQFSHGCSAHCQCWAAKKVLPQKQERSSFYEVPYNFYSFFQLPFKIHIVANFSNNFTPTQRKEQTQKIKALFLHSNNLVVILLLLNNKKQVHWHWQKFKSIASDWRSLFWWVFRSFFLFQKATNEGVKSVGKALVGPGGAFLFNDAVYSLIQSIHFMWHFCSKKGQHSQIQFWCLTSHLFSRNLEPTSHADCKQKPARAFVTRSGLTVWWTTQDEQSPPKMFIFMLLVEGA